MGPIELADQVGLDICLAVGDMLRSKFADSLPPTPAWLREKVAAGDLGRKTGRGFYIWKDGKPDKMSRSPATVQPTAEMIDPAYCCRCRTSAWPACARASSTMSDVVDGAMIFGTGYAAVSRRSSELCAKPRDRKRGVDVARAGTKIRWPVHAGCRWDSFQNKKISDPIDGRPS